MPVIKTLVDLQKIKDTINKANRAEEPPDLSIKKVQIKVSMATCGLASGAKDILSAFNDELEHNAIDALVTQTGCMGYCYAEPTIEVTLPGSDPVVFGFVDKHKVREIVEKYIIKGELVEGILPVNYLTPNNI